MRQFHELLLGQYETTIEAHFSVWVKNLRDNAPYIKKNVLDLPKPQSDTCVLVGPGPTIAEIKDINRLNKFYVMASPTVLPWMTEQGLKADLVVAVDRSAEMWYWIRKAEYKGQVAVPTFGNDEVAKNCDCYWFNILNGKPGYLPVIDAVVRTQYPELPQLPSTGHVGGAMFQLAMMLNHFGKAAFKRVVLVGFDYGYPDGKARVPITGSHPTETLNQDELVTLDGKLTNYKMAMYKERMLMLFRSNPIPVYQIGGYALNAVPSVSIANALRGTYPAPRSKGDWVREHERYYLQEMPRVLLPALMLPWWKRIISALAKGAKQPKATTRQWHQRKSRQKSHS